MNSLNDVKLLVLVEADYESCKSLVWLRELYPSVFKEVMCNIKLCKDAVIEYIKSQPYYK